MYPIIALWAHPRSMSTAFERIMRERGDLHCLHEPFMYYYYVDRSMRSMPHFDIDASQPVSYQAICQMLIDYAQTRPVFFKDMSYYVLPRLLQDEQMLIRISHTFLIRNPLKSIISYHKLDKNVTREEIGLEAQWRYFDHIRQAAQPAPVVIEAEVVQEHPEQVMRAYWQAAGLDFREHAFNWKNKTTPRDWMQVERWHDAINTSTGIQTRSPPGEESLRDAFFRYAEEVNAPHLHDYLSYHWPYYQKLRARAVRLMY